MGFSFAYNLHTFFLLLLVLENTTANHLASENIVDLGIYDQYFLVSNIKTYQMDFRWWYLHRNSCTMCFWVLCQLCFICNVFVGKKVKEPRQRCLADNMLAQVVENFWQKVLIYTSTVILLLIYTP